MRGVLAFIAFILPSLLAGTATSLVWKVVSPHFGRVTGLLVLAWFASVASLAAAFITFLVTESKIGIVLIQVLEQWNSGFSSEVKRLDEVVQEMKGIIWNLYRTLANQTVQSWIQREARREILRLTREFREHVTTEYNMMLWSMEALSEQARRTWFVTLPFVEELMNLPEDERNKLLPKWFDGLTGKEDGWKQLAEYFRKRSRK
ncbi:MAG: hypothetical protein [aquatic viral metagenome]